MCSDGRLRQGDPVVGLLRRFQIRHLYPLLPVALFGAITIGPVADNSFLWHIRAGSMQAATQRVLTTDPFSFMTLGESWRTQSWLVELGYASMESTIGGVRWAPIMVAVVGMATLGLLGLSIYGRNASTLATAVWLIVATWLLSPFDAPRPVIFSYLLVAALVLALQLGRRGLWVVVPLIWIWAGVHGSWVIGLGLVALEAIRRGDRRLGAAAAVAAGATLFTAHGIGSWVVLVAFARSTGALEFIQEWQPPDFGDLVQGPYLLVVGGILLAAVRGKLEVKDLIVVFPFLAFGLTSQRTVPVAALVLLPYAALALPLTMPKASRQNAAVAWAVAILMVIVVGAAHALPHDTFSSERFPSDAAVAAVGSGRFFHDDAVGGYLIYLRGPDSLIYIDDRAELYGAERFAEFGEALAGNYQELFHRLGMSVALVRSESSLHGVLVADGWTTEYEDEHFSVLADRQP